MSRIKQLWFFAEELRSLSHQEFENLIFETIQSTKNFNNVIKTAATNDPSYDLFADEKTSDTKTVKAIFQIKRTSLITPDFIKNIGDYWTEKGYFKSSKLYIVTEGAITDEASRRAKKYGIHIWDLYSLDSLINRTLKKKYFESHTQVSRTESKEENLSTALIQLEKGQSEWSTYQQLCCDIFSHLFSPPLSSPRFEHSDADDRNRRDMIYENSNDHSFWKMIREMYQAHYIVVDAKNSAELLGKRPVIDIAHYLKPYGCGMFGILLARIGTSEAANHAIKEQWIGNNKMIVTLNDNEILEMLKIKQANGRPEEIIRMKLADFRMSL
jgi:hypothetical protein